MRPYSKRIYYIIFSLKTTKPLFTVSAEVVHFSEKSKKIFWVKKAIKEANVTNPIMNLSHTLHVTADAKELSSILYSSGNIQIKSCWDPEDPPSATLSWQKPQYPEG